MKLSTEQIEQIIDGAPDGATHYESEYKYLKAARSGYMVFDTDGGDWDYEHIEICETHNLSDLREILALRQRVQKLEAQVPKWVGVENELPPIDTWVLWIDGDKTMDPRGSDYHIDKITERGECLMNYIHNYTHWMPLPKLSREKEDE